MEFEADIKVNEILRDTEEVTERLDYLMCYVVLPIEHAICIAPFFSTYNWLIIC